MFIRYKGKKHALNITFTRKPYFFEGPGSVVEVTSVKDYNQLICERCAGSFEEVRNRQGDPMPPEDEDIEVVSEEDTDQPPVGGTDQDASRKPPLVATKKGKKETVTV